MVRVEDLIGAWSLVSSMQLRNGEASKIYGDPPSGQIQYTADGRMSAFLMDPAWPQVGENASLQADIFFAYAGRWQLRDDEITHHLDFCAIPAKIGTDFTRKVKRLNDNDIELTTVPEVTNSGNTYQATLVWRKIT